MEPAPLLSVIIPTHNRSDALRLTLTNLSRQSAPFFWEAIVVNSCCADDTDKVVRGQPFPVALRLKHEYKPGAAAARNAGASAAFGQYLLFMDNDILTETDFLERHVALLQKYSGSWIVGKVVGLPEQECSLFGQFRKSLSDDSLVGKEIAEVDWLTGANMSLPRPDFELLGGFDEEFHVASGEDRELAIRAQRSGIRILFDPRIRVIHNDWAGWTIREYCYRQRLYSQTEPYFWRKYENDYYRLQLVKENLPPNWKQDRPFLFTWKHMKSILGSSCGQYCLIRACELLERFLPWRALVWRMYRMAIAGAIWKGFQEGLKHFSVYEGKSPAEKNHEHAAG